MAIKILSGGEAIQAAGRPGKETENIDHCRDLIPQNAVQRLATVERFKPGKFFTIRLDGVSQFQQALRTRFGRGLPPVDERPISGLYRRIDLGR